MSVRPPPGTVVHEFTCIVPILVARLNDVGRVETISIPEGGGLGFCGRYLWARDTTGRWQMLLTSFENLLRWWEYGHVAKKTPTPASVYKRYAKAIEKVSDEADIDQKITRAYEVPSCQRIISETASNL